MTLQTSRTAPFGRRTVRSYVIREGRMTAAQTRALQTLWPRYGLTLEAVSDIRSQFPVHQPLVLEIGTGDGDNLVTTAATCVQRNFLGCEVHRPGIGHALLRADVAGLSNLRMVQADALDLLAALPPAILDGAAVFFPDPWPKKRHRKRRLVNAAFLAALSTRMRRNGVLWFASDNRDYARAVLTLIESAATWENLAGSMRWAPRPRWRVHTRFEQRAINSGRAVYDVAARPLSAPSAG